MIGVAHNRQTVVFATGARLPLLFCALLWMAPGIVAMATRVWTTEQGAQGPLILVSGLWLLHHQLSRPSAQEEPGRPWVAVLILAPSLLLYILATVANMLTAILFAIWCGSIGLIYAKRGSQALKTSRFALAYLLFLIPPPVMIVGPIVQVLKQIVSTQAVHLAALFGLEVASRGNSLFVDQYELVVAAACAGMNSLFTLLALGLFYVHMRYHHDWWSAAALFVWIVPVALGANLIRVTLLLVAVHTWGAGVLETPLHLAAGLALAGVAMVMLMLIDVVISLVVAHMRQSRVHAL